MNWYFIPPFIASILLLFLAIFIYLKNKQSKLNILLSLECATSFVWLFSYSMMYLFSCNEKIATQWMRMGYVGVIFIPVLFCYFILEFLNLTKEKIIVYFCYVATAAFVFLHLKSNLFTNGLIKYFWGYYPRAGALHPIFLLFFISVIGVAIYHTFIVFIKREELFQDRRKKEQIKYIFLAFLLYSLACVDFIPNYNLNIYPFGYIFSTIFLSMIAYVIVHHQLLDIEIIIKKTLLFGGVFTSVYAIFAFFALLGQVFFERFITQNRWIAMIPSVVVVTIMLRPLENFLINITDKYLFQKKYDYKKLLKAFTSEVLMVLELDKLIKLTEDKLKEIMKLESCEFVGIGKMGTVPFGDSPHFPLKLPILINNKTVGTLVLGRKKSDEEYTKDDLDILNALTKTLGIAISNARLLEELGRIQAETAEKEKMATIGTLAAGMAHEIRNPITTIRNFADYLPEKYNNAVFVDMFKRLIPREIDRIESIARSLLEFSSSESAGERDKFAIDEPVRTVVSILEPQYRTSEITIHCDYKEKHVIRGSKIQLQDAFFNILNYVLAESQAGNMIVIECAVINEKLSLFVRNEGLVVAEHIIKDVFEPVSGLYRERRGFGFNLFVAKQLIERNGWALTITSDKSTGSEFRISFGCQPQD